MKKLFSTIILISIIGCLRALECDMNPKTTEGRLMKDVFCDYDKSIRPVKDLKNATIVKVKMILKSFDFDEQDDKITINSWMAMVSSIYQFFSLNENLINKIIRSGKMSILAGIHLNTII